jgi:pimeloyl-ACP methyl ester carboxylesterase
VNNPETRYARNGDATIAYQVFGEGPAMVWVPGFISHVELNWEAPFFSLAYARAAEWGRMITFDKRGTGLSDHTASFGSFEDRMSDIVAVMDAADLERANVGGISEGGPLALLFAATYPERVERLVLYGTFARVGWSEDNPDGTPTLPRLLHHVEATWGTGAVLKLFVQHAPDPEAEQRLMAKFERYTATPQQARHILSLVDEIDVRAILPSVHTPALVIHCKGDPMIPVGLGRHLAEHLPNCERFVEFDRDFHLSWLAEDADLFVDAVEEFVTGDITSRPVAAERVLGTVLFTDIVDSTTKARSVGDEAWRRVLDSHDAVCAAEIAAHRGRLIKSTGDGVLAMFDGPARAVQCAQGIVQRVQALGLQIRAGLHAGECDLRGDDVSGIAVHVAARVMSESGPDQVLTTGTVKDLALGSGLRFEPLGPRTFKGLVEPIAVYEAV